MQLVRILRWLSCNFFLPTSSSPSPCFVRVALFRSRAIEGWRGVVRSMPMCIYAIGVYTYRICGGHIQGMPTQYTYGRDVYVWSIGVRYIYLISVNVYGGYTYIRRFSATVSSFALDIYRYIISLTYFIYSIYSQDLRDNTFDLQFTVACGLRFHFTT